MWVMVAYRWYEVDLISSVSELYDLELMVCLVCLMIAGEHC